MYNQCSLKVSEHIWRRKQSIYFICPPPLRLVQYSLNSISNWWSSFTNVRTVSNYILAGEAAGRQGLDRGWEGGGPAGIGSKYLGSNLPSPSCQSGARTRQKTGFSQLIHLKLTILSINPLTPLTTWNLLNCWNTSEQILEKQSKYEAIITYAKGCLNVSKLFV